MEMKSEVAVVSAFGRGNWLAAEIAGQGIPTTLVDVTGQMGRWAPEDWEGPFGFLKSPGVKDSQVERLLEDEPPLMVVPGFTVWLPDGPLELKGPTGLHRMRVLGVPDEVMGYVIGEKQISDVRHLPFEKNWLAQFSHSFSSVTWTHLPESLEEGKRQDLFSSFFIRQATRPGLERSLKWVETKGCRVISSAQVKDISFKDRKTMAGFELKAERAEIFNAEKVIWCLSSEETSMLGESVQRALFPEGIIQPEWIWARYRFRFENQDSAAKGTQVQLPLHCVVISDLNLSWTYDNMIVLQKTASLDLFDAWIRIPNNHRFQKQYLEDRAKDISRTLEVRMPDHKMILVNLPQEAEMTFAQLGPARHPLYSRFSRSSLKPRLLDNVYLDSPERWNSLSWEGSFENQNQIFKDIDMWWTKKEELRKKREAKEAARSQRNV